MNKRSLMYSAAFAALVAGAGIHPAMAQKGVALAPVTQWAVNKVAGSDGVNGYCAMARRFRPNTILTIARNDGNEASFALDFQTPKFRQAEPMEVLLDPGVGQQRAFEVYPVSNQAFVIRLGQDEMFFGALEKTGFLRVEFAGNSYNFNLADIDTGQSKLATCVANSVAPAAGGDLFPPRSMSGQGTRSVQTEIDELKRQITMLKGDKQRLAEDIAAAPVPPVERADTSDSGSIVIDHLSQQITELEQENQDLKTKLKVVQNGGSLAPESSDKDKKVIARLTEENNKLRTALDSKQIDNIQVSVLNDRIKELQDENDRLRNAMPAEDMSAADKDTLARLAKENKDLQKQLEQRGTDASQGWALKQTISSLESENKTLKNQVASAASDRSKIELAESRKQLDALKSENKRLQNVVEASRITGDPAVIVKELKGQVQKLSEESAAKDQKMMELSKLTTELDMLKATNEELERQLVETATPSGRMAPVMEQKLAALETQNDALLQKIQTESDTAKKSDAADIEALKAENEQLKKTIADSQTMAETNKNLQTQLDQLRQENEQLKAQQANAASPSEELKKMQEENQRLQEQLKQKELEAAELPRLREEIARLQKENDELKKAPPVPAPAPVAAAPAGPNPEVENLTRENEGLRQQIAGMGAKDSEIADLKAKLQEQEAKITAAEDAQKKAEAAQKEAQDHAAKAAEEQSKKLKEAQASADKAAQKLKDAQVAKPASVAEQPAKQAAAEPVSVQPEPVKAAGTAEQKKELKRLEKKLSKAKASGDQMAIQQTARDYMRLKNQINGVPADTPPAPNDPVSELLAFKQSDAPQSAVIDNPPAEPSMDAEVAGTMGGQAASIPPAEDLLQPVASASEAEAAGDAGINDAQRQEQAMMASKPAAVVSPPASQADENLSVRASEDPFADIKAQDNFKGYEATPAGEVRETTTTDDGRNARIATPAEVQESQKPSQQSMNEVPASPSNVPVADVQTAQSGKWAPATPAPVNSASHGGIYSPAVNMPQILGSANVVAPGSVTMVSNASGADKVAYQWRTDKAYGSSLQKQLSDPGRFDDEVKAYLNQTQKRCGKDFAVVPDDSTQNGDVRIDTYEIACVGQGVSSSASLLFFAKQGTFTVVAHEAPTADLESAIDMREKIKKQIVN